MPHRAHALALALALALAQAQALAGARGDAPPCASAMRAAAAAAEPSAAARARRPAAGAARSGRPLRVLCLPGFRQTREQLARALASAGWERELAPFATLECVQAPTPAGGEAPEWWNAKTLEDGSVVYDNWRAGLRAVRRPLAAAAAQQRPFDGILGYSQGGAVASVYAALAMQGRLDEDLGPLIDEAAGGCDEGSDCDERRTLHSSADIPAPAFVVGVSCMPSRANEHRAFFAHESLPLQLPALAVTNKGDRIVPSEATLEYAALFAGGRVVELEAGSHRLAAMGSDRGKNERPELLRELAPFLRARMDERDTAERVADELSRL